MKIVQASGQTCNQFWIYSNFLADAIETHTRFVILVPDVDFVHFPKLFNSKYIIYPFYSRRIAQFVGNQLYIKFLRLVILNKLVINVLKTFAKLIPKLSFEMAGTRTAKSTFKYKHLQHLIDYFSPAIEFKTNVDSLITDLRNQYDFLIGVHIRYGDYKTYKNGAYYYSLLEYAANMKKCKALFPSLHVGFIIVSNENIDAAYFEDLPCHYSQSKSMAEDLYCLSQVDYLMGPPSTFSAWASLSKNTPIYFIEDAMKDFSLADFIDIKGVWF
jgi:hypothetical protein